MRTCIGCSRTIDRNQANHVLGRHSTYHLQLWPEINADVSAYSNYHINKFIHYLRFVKKRFSSVLNIINGTALSKTLLTSYGSDLNLINYDFYFLRTRI